MPVHNSEIADLFELVADLLEIRGANAFRVRAYRNAARTVRAQSRSVARMLANGEDLSELPDIGEDLAGKIAEFARTGRLRLLDEIRKEIPEALAQVTAIPGIGPKRARALHEALGIASLDDLRRAAEEGRVARLAGFGPKTEARILEELSQGDLTEHRLLISVAEDFAAPLIAFARALDGVQSATVAGSYRRRKETVGDLDIVAVAKGPGTGVTDAFTGYDEIAKIVSKGKTRATVMLRSGLQVDLRVVPPESLGAALHYFTGSKAHNIACRQRAVRRGLKLNEYGVFRGTKRIAGRTEEDVYAAVGLPYIVPELREDRGEIDAAESGRLPNLITVKDLRGDLHVHTQASDGRNDLGEMAQAARARGYEYIAITDHSQSQRIAGGIDEKTLRAQLAEIDRLNEDFTDFRLLKSSEVDILEDGRLDYPDSLLDELDLVVAAVHGNFGLPEKAQTDRIVRAMDNPRVSVIAHPTGRLIGKRRPYAVDMERIVAAAAERGCALELNANPMRLDMDDIRCRMAKAAGVPIAISTDAHSVEGYDMMRFGVGQARRGWLESGDVLNTRPLRELKRLLRHA